jgi:hypothetical protein
MKKRLKGKMLAFMPKFFEENIVFGILYLILPKKGIYNRKYI